MKCVRVKKFKVPATASVDNPIMGAQSTLTRSLVGSRSFLDFYFL